MTRHLILLALLISGCENGDPAYQFTVPFNGTVFDLMSDDMDDDGRQDLLMVSHGRDYARVTYQKELRKYDQFIDLKTVGFHPGTFMRWPGREPYYLLSGEGSNALHSFVAKPEVGLELVKSLDEKKPLQTAVFHWPGWGQGLVLIPYESDEVILYRDFDLKEMKYAERIAVPLAKQRPSLREAGRASIVDVDKDGIEEIYFTVGITGEVLRLKYPANNDPPEPELVTKISFGMPDSILWIDINEDGFLDLIIPDKVPRGWIHIMINNGQGGFKEASMPNLLPGQELQQFAIAKDKSGKNTMLIVGVTTISVIQFPNGWSGGAGPEIVSVPRAEIEPSLASLLKDIDKDGWLDAVIGLDRQTEGAWIVHGPLWEHFKQLAESKFVLKPEKTEK